MRDSPERRIVVRYAAEGVPDDPIRNGPMVVSATTLQTVADWFPDITLEESRRRFRGINTRVAPTQYGKLLSVGDLVDYTHAIN